MQPAASGLNHPLLGQADIVLEEEGLLPDLVALVAVCSTDGRGIRQQAIDRVVDIEAGAVAAANQVATVDIAVLNVQTAQYFVVDAAPLQIALQVQLGHMLLAERAARSIRSAGEHAGDRVQRYRAGLVVVIAIAVVAIGGVELPLRVQRVLTLNGEEIRIPYGAVIGFVEAAARVNGTGLPVRLSMTVPRSKGCSYSVCS